MSEIVEIITENKGTITEVFSEKKSYKTILVSVFCIGIIIFIFFTQCRISTIKLQMKDASLILIFFALLAYINGYHLSFLILLVSFLIIYFAPNSIIDKVFSNFLKKEKKEKKQKKQKKKPVIEEEITIDNEITLDTEIGDLDDDMDIIKKKEE